MVIDREITNIRAFDNRNADQRIVINYSSVALSDQHNTWSVVDKFYVYSYNDNLSESSEFYIKVDECEIITSDGEKTNKMETSWFSVEKIGDIGQREILFETKDDKFKMLFEHRNKSLRVIKNSYLIQNIKGSMFKRNHVKLNSLEYIEYI
mgnify:CR=1 FL=1